MNLAPLRPPIRRLIVTADDFGRSRSVNEAVIQAHTEGILTTASLMVAEAASDHAVELAARHSDLGVGLHLVLCCGSSSLPQNRACRLVDSAGLFDSNPVRAGWRYFFDRSLRDALQREIREQFRLFQATGLKLDHVTGHLQMHLHPVVLSILAAEAAELGIRAMRLTRDPLWLNLRLAPGRWACRLTHAAIFKGLGMHARVVFDRAGIRRTQRVFGLLQNGCMNEEYLCRLIECLPPGDSEIYAHPSLDAHRHEYTALTSPRARADISARGIRLVRYQDL